MVVKTVGVEFFCYHRDRPGSVTLRDELLEEHWSYMDRYAAEVITRGRRAANRPHAPVTTMQPANTATPAADPAIAASWFFTNVAVAFATVFTS